MRHTETNRQINVGTFASNSSSDSFLNGKKIFNQISLNLKEGLFRCTHRRIVSFNPAFLKMFEFVKTGELIGTDLESIFFDQNEYQEAMSQLDLDGAIFNKEVRFKGKGSHTFYGSINLIKVISDRGIIHFDGAIRDITQEKINELLTVKQAYTQKVLLKISSDYINSKASDINDIVTQALQEMGEFLCVDRVNVHYYDFSKNECAISYEWCREGIRPTITRDDIISLDDIKDFVSQHQQGNPILIPETAALEEGIPKRVLLSFGIKSLMTIPLNVSASCVGFIGFDSVLAHRGYTDQEISGLKLFADLTASVTTRSVREKKLTALVEQTSIQNRRLKEFSFITSHNIRSSASNLMVLSDFISQDPNNLKYIRMLQSTVGKLDLSIKEASDLLNIDNSFELNELKKQNSASSIKKVLRWHKNVIDQKGIEIRNMLPSSLKVMAIPSYMDNVFNQLIANAIKFGVNDKSKKIFIDFVTYKEQITIRIRDFGPGIDLKRNAEKLFQVGGRFHQDSCDSMGMGLFLAKFQIEAMGGRIALNSEMGHGTSVEVTFLKK